MGDSNYKHQDGTKAKEDKERIGQLMNVKKLGYAGRQVLKGLAQLGDVKPAKLPHCWFSNIPPSPCFQHIGNMLRVKQPSAISGIQLLLWDPRQGIASRKEADGIDGFNSMFPTEQGNVQYNFMQPLEGVRKLDQDPLGPANTSTQQPSDIDRGFGIPATINLQALSFPIKTIPNYQDRSFGTAIGTSDQTAEDLTTNINRMKHTENMGMVYNSFHAGMRLKNYVSAPTVYVKRVRVDLEIHMNSIQQTFENWAAGGMTNPGMGNVTALMNNAFLAQQLDFRVLVLQNTDSFRAKWGVQPRMGYDLFQHPMGDPSEGCMPFIGDSVTNAPGLTEQITRPITGWPVRKPVPYDPTSSSNDDTTLMHNAEQCMIPNQCYPNYGMASFGLAPSGTPAATGIAPAAYTPPLPKDVMNAPINQHAYRVLHDEKFSLSANSPFLPKTDLPARKDMVLDFPVNGMVEIGGGNTPFVPPPYNVQNQMDADNDMVMNSQFRGTMGSTRRSPQGWEARNIYHNCPRILVLATQPNGRTLPMVHKFNAAGVLVPAESLFPPWDQDGKFDKAIHKLWSATTRGYTVYRDTPTDFPDAYPTSKMAIVREITRTNTDMHAAGSVAENPIVAHQ